MDMNSGGSRRIDADTGAVDLIETTKDHPEGNGPRLAEEAPTPKADATAPASVSPKNRNRSTQE